MGMGCLACGWFLSSCASSPKSQAGSVGSSEDWEEFDEPVGIDELADPNELEEPPLGNEGTQAKTEDSPQEGIAQQEMQMEAPVGEGAEDGFMEEKAFVENTLPEGDMAENEDTQEFSTEEEPLGEEPQSSQEAFEEGDLRVAENSNSGYLQTQEEKAFDAGASLSVPSTSLVRITDIEFVAEKEGGTVMIETDGNPSYNTRFNEKTHQFVLEIFNSELPSKLGRPFNTKDFQSNITFINAYQNQNGSTNVVVQLREGSQKPHVKMENNVLLVSTGSFSNGATPSITSAKPLFTREQNQSYTVHEEVSSSKILSAHSLQQFLVNNNRFYGRKISIITKEMQLKDFFNFIAEESGINLVLSKQIVGEVSLKLRNVPWDQALVVVMKANNLGYTRHGNVLRIAPLNVLRAEEEEAQKLFLSRKKIEPIHVYTLPVGYADVDQLKDKLKPFLSTRGHIAGDRLTSSLIVTDTKDHIENIEKLVNSLDIPPPQVFIEGKVVEASSTFSKELGVNWGIGGGSFELSKSGTNTVSLSPELNIAPGGGAVKGKAFFSGINVGILKNLGSINAFLSLNERKEQIKVISSPRIMTVNNGEASISQKTEIPIITSVNDGGAVTQNVTFKPVNLKLNVVPQVTGDDSVLLKVDVVREFLGSAISTNDPARPINSRSAKTKVLVKNGDTAVIGGILQSDVTKGETGVPFLSKIPILGALFRTKSETKDQTELLIFLTPKIIYNPHARATKKSDMSHPNRQNKNEHWGNSTEEFSEEGGDFGKDEEPIMYEQGQ